MRIVDCHVHVCGKVNPNTLLKQMDKNGIERVILISETERVNLEKTHMNLRNAANLIKTAPDRISGLARLNPLLDGINVLAERALQEMGFSGFKIIPDHWFPYEFRLEPFWERMNDLRASILFHTGILWGFEDGSRFCRPIYLEKLLHYPNIRFAMAHISWPWCDECLAVMGRMKDAAQEKGNVPQSYIDITPGTPRYVRKQALTAAIDYCGIDRLMFGSDCTVPSDLSAQHRTVEEYLKLLDEIGLNLEEKEQIMSATADSLFP
jgi:predicted TIM-barrel fold metal-dependent hydrolase